jgi:hypothetical protein
MYGFTNIEGFPVWEYYFKEGLAKFSMMITDGDENPLKRTVIIIPGFYMNDKGEILSISHIRKHGYKDVCFLPPKDKVEQQVKAMVSGCKHVAIKESDTIIICASEESKQIGMVMAPKKDWKPMFSIF